MKNKQNIAMLCNQEQFEAIKPKLEKIGKIGILSGAFTKYNYLTNNFDLIDEFDFIGNCSYWEKEHSGNVHEQWNEKVFLDACGIETTPTLDEVKEYFKNAEVIIGADYEDRVCISDGIEEDVSEFLGSYWIKIKGNKKGSIKLWCKNNGYAKIISYKQPKFEITKEQILAIHRCASVMNQIDIESWFPQVFEKEKAKLQEYYTGWYKHKNNEFPNWLMYYDFKKRIGYGIGANPEWVDKYYNINNYIEENCMPATQKEVEQALKNEAVRRGLVKGKYCKHENPSIEQYKAIKDYFYNERDNCLYGDKKDRGGARLFQNGIWATIIPTKTKEEAEKLLNCKIV